MQLKKRLLVTLIAAFASAAQAGDFESCVAQTPNSFAACERLSSQGDADGLFGLGLLYLDVDGIGTPVDYDKSFKLMLKAAQLGHANAQLQVGQAYANGQGVRRNYNEGYAWLLASLKNGNPVAQQGIDFMRSNGMVKASQVSSIEKRAQQILDMYGKWQGRH